MPLFKHEDSKRMRHAIITYAMATNVLGLNVSDDGKKLVIYKAKSFYLGNIDDFFYQSKIQNLREKEVPTDKEARFKNGRTRLVKEWDIATVFCLFSKDDNLNFIVISKKQLIFFTYDQSNKDQPWTLEGIDSKDN